MVLSKISVTILAKNAQSTLRECLESVREFDEVILLDNKSTDQTQEIAKEFPNVKIYESEFIGFGALKNLAISYAKNDWILSLDSDEVLERALLEEIREMEFCKGKYYSFLRKNHYRGVWIKGCGWHPDWVKRIFYKHEIRFDDALVHEGLILGGCEEVRLRQGGILHYSFFNISDLLEKLQRYSSLWAMQNSHKSSSPFKAVMRGSWTFVRNYFFKRGFLYGYRGFVISVCNGLGAFFKYMKLYEESQATPKVSLIVTTYNQKERLALVLDSIKNQKVLPFEVLIADDGSTEDTKTMIEKYQKSFPIPIRHIWQEDLGYRLAQSRNQAILRANGEYLVIVDGDMILHPRFIEDHLAFATRGVFVQGGRILLDSKETDSVMQTKDLSAVLQKKSIKNHRLKCLSRLIFALSAKTKTHLRSDVILSVRGCNMAFYKQDAQRINGFNQAFRGWGREDSEFVARFLYAGGKMKKLKFRALAYHLHHEENSRDMLEENHQIYSNCLKHQKTWCDAGLQQME
nr:glycosyltransferase [Helicobacter pametensis]